MLFIPNAFLGGPVIRLHVKWHIFLITSSFHCPEKGVYMYLWNFAFRASSKTLNVYFQVRDIYVINQVIVFKIILKLNAKLIHYALTRIIKISDYCICKNYLYLITYGDFMRAISRNNLKISRSNLILYILFTRSISQYSFCTGDWSGFSWISLQQWRHCTLQ